MRHRINAGRVAVRNQQAFFGRQFGQVSSEWKEDDTRVTFADFAISEKVFAELRRDFPGDDFCSEEASPHDEAIALEATYCWVIDPVDGTNNYALGFPLCAISLALLRDGVPVYGFIYDYSVDGLVEGGPGFGLLREGKKVDPGRGKKEAPVQTLLGLHFPMEEWALTRLTPMLARYRVRALGSAALLGSYVATGYLAATVDFRVKVWDIAAAYALCAAADRRFAFLGERSPFPLRSFHPRCEVCPYVSGTDKVVRELLDVLR